MVSGTTRSADKAKTLEAKHNITAHIMDVEAGHPLGADAGHGVSHMLVSIPARSDAHLLPGHAGPRNAEIADFIKQNFPDLSWVGYLSTTGVYGDHQGAWVDEATPCRPLSKRSQMRLAEEKSWQKACAERGVGLDIFRLAGIYGPGKNAITSLRRGKARVINKPGQVFGRIHTSDIAAAVFKAMEQNHDGSRIFNLSDDLPTAPQDVTQFASELTGLPMPSPVDIDDPSVSEMARSFYSECKRTKNDKAKAELGLKLKYPTYKEGLQAAFDQGD